MSQAQLSLLILVEQLYHLFFKAGALIGLTVSKIFAGALIGMGFAGVGAIIGAVVGATMQCPKDRLFKGAV